MLGKKNAKRAGVLTDRIKAISDPNAHAETEYVDTHIRNDGRAKREPTYKQATIQMRTGERVPVVVKNVSATGARIDYFKSVPLSDVVYLIEPTLDIATWCDVIWERDNSAGLRFLPS